MTKMEFDRYAACYFTVRRSNKFASGISSDTVIGQTANRKFKMVRGVIRRDLIDGVLSSWCFDKNSSLTDN